MKTAKLLAALALSAAASLAFARGAAFELHLWLMDRAQARVVTRTVVPDLPRPGKSVQRLEG